MQFDLLAPAQPLVEDETFYNQSLSQYMTPGWAAEAIVAHALPDLPARATVIEPSCGIGRFLQALPEGINAIGVEIDARLADIARATTNATIITGDFRNVPLPVERCDCLIGNPPFEMAVWDGMLDRAHQLLDDGGRVIMVLPAFTFQTSSRVVRYNQRWSLSQEMMPRNIFPGIRLPLMLANFTKDPKPRLSGLILYHESREIEEMPAVYRRALSEGRSGWRAVVEEALKRLGGEATVDQVCSEIAPRKPTTTDHWRPKVRQQLMRHCRKMGPARYALAA